STGHTILLVDDEADIQKIVSKYLTVAGFTVIQASNGQEALAKINQLRPSLVIMDMMMPVMDGVETTKKLRSQEENSKLPILMLTARDDADAQKEMFDAGVDDYLHKPFDVDKLIARIKILLNKRHSE
ncbi:MAG: response regulator transcription factor, partial [Candidatus Omnitrophica bacterium]|nr:response regulator transcription factor [Candidatus Omnitrophota bacterium]